MFQKIPFSGVKEMAEKEGDSTSFVWTALTFREEDFGPIEEWLKEISFLPLEAKIVDMRQISGNVKGDKGRSDILFVLCAPTPMKPLVRLKIDGLKWTTDFVDNYARDYR